MKIFLALAFATVTVSLNFADAVKLDQSTFDKIRSALRQYQSKHGASRSNNQFDQAAIEVLVNVVLELYHCDGKPTKSTRTSTTTYTSTPSTSTPSRSIPSTTPRPRPSTTPSAGTFLFSHPTSRAEDSTTTSTDASITTIPTAFTTERTPSAEPFQANKKHHAKNHGNHAKHRNHQSRSHSSKSLHAAKSHKKHAERANHNMKKNM